mgnify:FL=1
MDEKLIDIAINATKAYKKYSDRSPAMREVMFQKEIYPAVLLPIRDGDLFAGRISEYYGAFLPVDFNAKVSAQIGYRMNITVLKELKGEYPKRKNEIEDLIDFWKKGSTFVKIREEAPKEIHDYLFSNNITLDDDGYKRIMKKNFKKGSGFICGSMDTRIAGIVVNYDKLLTGGIPGLLEEIHNYKKQNLQCEDFYNACEMSIETLINCLQFYSDQAFEIAEKELNEQKKEKYIKMALILKKLQTKKPETLREAMQLMLMYAVLVRADNYGRMDVFFGDFLENDLKEGRLTEEDAIALIIGLYDQLTEFGDVFDTRIVIGGYGRRNERLNRWHKPLF